MENPSKMSKKEEETLLFRLAMPLIIPVSNRMIEEVAAEVLGELLQEEEEVFQQETGFFDSIFEVDDDLNVTYPADAERQEKAPPTPEPVPDHVPELPEDPNQPEVLLTEEDKLDLEEAGHRLYVMDRRNINTVKKTASVSGS